MNAAINGTASSRPFIWRRSKAHRQLLFKRLLVGLPFVMVAGWEYRVWKRKLYFERNRAHFPGSTPFYGKMWGYESDYMIEESLADGDMVFWAVDPLSVHIHEAVCRFASRRIKGDYDAWDFCGLVRRANGTAYVVGHSGVPIRYSDVVADHRTTTLAVRQLLDTSAGGDSRARITSRLPLDPTQCSQNVPISARDLLENSVKAIVTKLGTDRWISRKLEGWIRPESKRFPLNVLESSNDTIAAPGVEELSECFINPLIFKEQSISYSPPFFVRRCDNEYYNHNQTKNIIVDWELLVQRDIKNRLVSKHSQD